MAATDVVAEQRDALVGRMFESMLGAMELDCAYLGRRLGFYRAIAAKGGMTSAELSASTGTNERYTREWLEQQAVAGVLSVDDVTAPARDRRYVLPEGHAEVLLDESSLNHMMPATLFAVSFTQALPAVVDAFRSGDGVPYAAYGEDLRDGVAGFNRPLFERLLGTVYLPAIPEIHQRLIDPTPARVLDVACGGAWSSIAIARAYRNVRIEAIDADPASVDLAQRNIAAAGLDDRITVALGDAATIADDNHYEVVAIFEALHDMSDPVGVLAGLRRLITPNGSLLVMDERVAETFTAPGDDVERFMYGCSVLHCLPVGMADQPSAETGTVMRSETVQRYAAAAGYHRVEVLALEHDFFRFYRLEPHAA
jgi:2-polyprenyl-3-methyl-5-hydroxy-6-metoxy-1,4-benzoquinol methylase